MAPILTSFSRYVVSDQCSTSMGNANVSYGSRLCENDFLEAETKYKIEKLAFAATMIRPGYLPDSIVAQLASVSAFSHSLDPQRTLVGVREHCNLVSVKCGQSFPLA